MNGEIFINYRSADTHGYVALLYLELTRRFGADRVFLDSESIPAGADYAEQLLCRVRRARAVLAVIGPAWSTATGARWRPRLRKPTDWTQRELAEAFAAGISVIPVLTDHAQLPTRRDLPVCLTQLSRCQYRRLRCRDFKADLERIISDLIAADPQLARAAGRRAPATVQPPEWTTPDDRWTEDRSRRWTEDRSRRARAGAPAVRSPQRLRLAAGGRLPAHQVETIIGPDQDPYTAIYRALVDSRKRCLS